MKNKAESTKLVLLLLLVLSSCVDFVLGQDEEDTNSTTRQSGILCALNLDPGFGCSSPGGQLWYYDRFSNRCKQFMYRGCGGNANQFSSEAKCQITCYGQQSNYDDDQDGICNAGAFDPLGSCTGSDACPNTPLNERPVDANGCSKRQVDSDMDGVCNPGVTSTLCTGTDLCQATPANQRNQVDESGCIANIPVGCQQPPQQGTACGNSQTRWYYNTNSQACDTFIFLGCNGNQNNFPSPQICQQACISWDDDRDGVCNPGISDPRCVGNDRCPSTPANEPVDANGCSRSQVDEDLDGVCNPGVTSTLCRGSDLCLGTLPSQRDQVDSSGCVPILPACIQNLDPGQACPVGSGITTSWRWYYDRFSNDCTQFTYYGCGGNNNNFPTRFVCERACVDVCRLPRDAGPCSNFEARWWYDSNRGECVQFPYGGCLGNENNFENFDQCTTRCSGIDVIDEDGDGICDPGRSGPSCIGTDLCPSTPVNQPVDGNGCSRSQVDSDLDGVCNPGVTSTLCSGRDQCPGTPANQLVDGNGCSRSQVDSDLDGVCNPGKTSTLCSGSDQCPGTPLGTPVDANGCPFQTTCYLGFDQGDFCPPGGPGPVERWYYSGSACAPFYYRGCGGNSNRYTSKANCQQVCGSDVCLLPKDRGPCIGSMERYWYDSNIGLCVKFDYGGCYGNGNNFEDFQQCVLRCSGTGGIDDDGDGVCNFGMTGLGCVGNDYCPSTPANERPVDSRGCSRSEVDEDLDGVCNPGVTSTLCSGSDQCLGTPPGTQVDENGCPVSPQCPTCPMSVFDTLPPGCTSCVP